MIDLKMEQLAVRLIRAIDSIGPNEQHKLISITKQIDKRNPLQVFEGAKSLEKDRTFWMNSNRTLTLIGVGKVKTIEAYTDRFSKTEKEWKRVIKDAWIDNPYKDKPGTGIVALGGMTFDPLKETTDLWKKFKPSQFYIPELLLAQYEEEYFLTMNVLVSKNDRADMLADFLMSKEREFLSEGKLVEQELTVKKEIEIDPKKWKDSVVKATEEIREKKSEKIVLAREVRLHFNTEANIAAVLNQLLETQQNSYVFAFESEGDAFVGASPERLVKVEQNNLLSTCLAGTAPRGKTAEEDQEIGHNLYHDEKNREEHDFVVQMIKQAIQKSCTNVVIPEEPVLYPLKNLQHLYTPVTAQLKKNFTIFDVVEELHPTPALGGTPKKESLAFIREHELLDRGWYGAPIGWLDSNDNGEFAVAIRSALIQQDEASLFAGCGVVLDSDPEMEYEETKIKLLPMLTVLGGNHESY